MPMTIQTYQTVRLTCTFITTDPNTGGEALVPAINVGVMIYKYTLGIPNGGTGPFETVQNPNGGVYYDWTPIQTGKYEIVFSTTIDSEVVEDRRIFYVGAITTTQSLVTERTYHFIGELDPMFVDIEEVFRYYPDGDAYEIVPLIYWYSQELMSILGVTTLEIEDLPTEGHTFVLASILCELSRIYTFDGGLAGFTKADMFMLGDLKIGNNSGSSNKNSFTGIHGEPSSWCELATYLRASLSASRVTIVSYVKSGNYLNPIKTRELRRFE